MVSLRSRCLSLSVSLPNAYDRISRRNLFQELAAGAIRSCWKLRTIHFHPSTLAELDRYHILREIEVQRARRKNPHVKVPDELMIYATERWKSIGAYQKTAIDYLVNNVSVRSGVKFTNHTLRRTCGRVMYLAGVDIATISKVLGHEDIKTTIRYLGLNMDDMSAGMEKYARYQNALKTANSGLASKGSGRIGI
jgi:integrase